VDIDNRVLLSSSGPTAGIFEQEQPDNEVAWGGDFSTRIGPNDIAQNWRDALHSLVVATLQGNFTDSDQLVFSHDEKRLFRLFVSKTTTFVDRTRQLDIYVLQTPYLEDAGDPETTFLGKAIAIALRYRSLFLEPGSPYGPSVRFWAKDEWKPKISQLLRELRLLVMQSHEAGMNRAQHIVDVYGLDSQSINNVVGLMQTYESQRTSLQNAAAAVVSQFKPAADTFDVFVKALDDFRTQTGAMNTEFLTKLLQRLEFVLGARKGAVEVKIIHKSASAPAALDIAIDSQSPELFTSSSWAKIDLMSGQHVISLTPHGATGPTIQKVVTIEPGGVTKSEVEL
jgi:hypothetical protein